LPIILRFNNTHNVTDTRHLSTFGGADVTVALRIMN
jgi:hypothetical protein